MYWLHSPLYKVGSGEKAEYFYSYSDFINSKHGSGQVIRIKGLGQLETDDLKMTMFNEKNRKLTQIEYNSAGEDLLMDLMGQDVKPRRDFVFNVIDFGGIKIG